MRIFKFIKWCWDSYDEFERALFLFFVTAVIPFVIVSLTIDLAIGLIYLLCAVTGFFVVFLSIEVYRYVKRRWQTFSEENPPDDVRIMNRLRGRPDNGSFTDSPYNP